MLYTHQRVYLLCIQGVYLVYIQGVYMEYIYTGSIPVYSRLTRVCTQVYSTEYTVLGNSIVSMGVPIEGFF